MEREQAMINKLEKLDTEESNTDTLIFVFNGHNVRVQLDEDGTSWFLAKDVCDALGYYDGRKTLQDHVDSEDVSKRNSLSLGGRQLANYINESGLYALIFASQLPAAKAFKRWVTSEVLPSLRKTGQYGTPGAIPGQMNWLMLGTYCRWDKMFQDELVSELCKVKGVKFEGRHPRWAAKIYEEIYRCVLSDAGYVMLKKRNPEPSGGKNHHQVFPDEQRKALSLQLDTILKILKSSPSLKDFLSRIRCAYKGLPIQLTLESALETNKRFSASKND